MVIKTRKYRPISVIVIEVSGRKLVEGNGSVYTKEGKRLKKRDCGIVMLAVQEKIEAFL